MINKFVYNFLKVTFTASSEQNMFGINRRMKPFLPFLLAYGLFSLNYIINKYFILRSEHEKNRENVSRKTEGIIFSFHSKLIKALYV